MSSSNPNDLICGLVKVILDLTNFHLWIKFIIKILTKYPHSGKAIKNGIEYIIHRPHSNDLLPGEIFGKYDKLSGGGLSADGKKDLRNDHNSYNVLQAKFEEEEAQAICDIETYISTSSAIILASNSAYSAASTINNSFQLIQAISFVHLGSTSLAVKIGRTIKFFKIKQGDGTFEDLKEAILLGRQNLMSDLGSKSDPTMISVDVLVAAAFLEAVNYEQFKFLIDSTLSLNPTGMITDLDAIIQKFQDFSNQKTILPVVATTGTNKNNLQILTTTTLLDITTCVKCKKEFPTITGPSGSPYVYCKDCSAAYKKSKTSTELPSDAAIKNATELLAKAKAGGRSINCTSLLSPNEINQLVSDNMSPTFGSFSGPGNF